LLLRILVLFLALVNVNAQDTYIRIICKDQTTHLAEEPLKLGSKSVEERLMDLISELREANHLEASIDSLELDSLNRQHKAWLHLGPKYDFGNISLDSLDRELLDFMDYRQLNNKREYLDFRARTTRYYSNNGYPFARLSLNSDNGILPDSNAYLSLDPGPVVHIDSILLNGDLRITKRYIQKYLDIAEGELYNHKNIQRVAGLIDRLSFTDQYNKPEITFFGNNATLDLYLNEKNASRFDFIFGIIPTSSLNDRSLFLSFDITAELLNKMGYGEYIFVDFERLRPEQQKFEFRFNYPYILGLDYGLDVEFNIFRLALDYQTLYSDIGIEYIINATDRLKLSWNYESSNIVEIDSTVLFSTGQLPEDLDVSLSGLSAELQMSTLDYPLNPRKGYRLNVKATGGIKTIQRNSAILMLENDAVDFANAYDTIDLRSARVELKAKLEHFAALGTRSALGSHIDAGMRYSEQGLYRNEKFQIGGHKLLRGFDEAQFFSAYYAVGSLEYRLLLSNNSYLSAPFIDFGIIEDSTEEPMWVIGIGGGLGIETRAGLFSFSIAVGRSSQLDFDFRRPKAHLGFVSLF